MERKRVRVARTEATSFEIRLLAVGMAVLTALVVLAASAGDASGQRPQDAPVLNVGHRGASGQAPEHTLPAYDRALGMGADYIEQDLQLTRDGVLVVMHDSTLDRTARPTERSGPGDCTGPVISKTLKQIKTCDVGSWFNEAYPEYAQPEYVGLKVPTLEQVFRRYGRGTNYYIETKSPEQAPGMEEELLRLMGKYRLIEPSRESWRVLIQSFSPASLQKIHRLRPSLPLVQLYPRQGSPAVQASLEAARTYAVGVGPAKEDTDAPLVKAAHDRCLDVHPYTVNEPPEMRKLVNLGVDGMFTNFPNRLERVLGEDAARGNTAAGLAVRTSRACRANSR